MKINEMIKREDFYNINNDTLSIYFKKKYSADCLVNTINPCKNSTFYVLKHLNAIISSKPSKKIKKYLYTEYRVNKNLLKKLIIKFYLILSLNFPRMFADRSIVVDCNTKENSSNLLIYPCNRKIRIFDFSINMVDVILKNGYSNNTIINEINFRINYHESFIHPILEHNDSSYNELIIDGIPLARISKKSIYSKLVNISVDYMKLLHEKTAMQIKIKDYVSITRKNILKLLSLDIDFNRQILDNYNKIDSFIISNTIEYESNMTIGLSHGDLQHGNVWLERKSNAVKIIDWESAAFRSKWYDIFIIKSGSRKKENLQKLFREENFIKTIYNLESNRESKMVSNILLLEDVSYTVEEQMSLPNSFGEEFLSKYMKYIVDEIID